MRILVATDGSPHSALTLQAINSLHPLVGTLPTILTVARQERDRSQAQSILQQAKQMVQPTIGQVTTRLRVGPPATEIAKEAYEGKYDLLVLGHKPENSLLTRLLGSTVSRALAEVPCSILIVKERNISFLRVLLCEGGLQPNLLSRLISRCGPLLREGTNISVLHVMSQMIAAPGVPGWELRAEARELMKAHTREGELLQQDMEVLQRVHVQPVPLVRHGLVVEEILAEARRGDYGLVVIGAHQHDGWQSMLLADIARQLVGQLDRSVLVVR